MAASGVTQASEAARRYARALFELAQDKGELAKTDSDFKTLARMIASSEDLRTLLDSPAFGREEKVRALGDLAKKSGMGKLFSNFLGVMGTNGRAVDLLGAQKAFDELYAAQRGVQRVTVRTPKTMTGEESQRIESLLAKAVGGEVELTSEVDPSLIGGIQLRIGSRLIDASLAAKLERMNTAMKGA